MRQHTTPLFRRNDDARIAYAIVRRHREVQVVEWPLRRPEGARIYRGKHVAVATAPTAGGSSVIVIRAESPDMLDRCVSLANVASLDVIDGAGGEFID